MSQQSEQIILGIDPGTIIMGYGLISVVQKKIELIDLGVVNLEKIKDPALKLKNIFESALQIMEQYKPDEMAIEAQFYGKNVQSMLKLGRAQGVTIAAALYRTIPIFEYSPKKIKQSVCGNGNASKEQVAGMVKHLLNLKEVPASMDAADAVAVALCHHFQKGITAGGKSYKGWGSFLKNNPNRMA